MAFSRSHFTGAAIAASAARFFTGNMANGAYAPLASTMPTEGARHITVTHTAAGAVDTLGTITVVGTNLLGQTISEVITPLNGTVATSTKWFKTYTSATQAGWVIGAGNDTITIGCSAACAVSEGAGSLHGVVVNTTAAGAITLADSAGTIAILKSSIAEGFYGPFDVNFSGALTVAMAAASDITVIHTSPSPA